jgi:uncharacterized protein DUF4331
MACDQAVGVDTPARHSGFPRASESASKKASNPLAPERRNDCSRAHDPLGSRLPPASGVSTSSCEAVPGAFRTLGTGEVVRIDGGSCMRNLFTRPRWLGIAAGLAALTATIATTRSSSASDHQDTPEVELSPRMDINDVYAFPGSSADRITLVLTTSSPITPAQAPSAAFDPNLLYQLKIDNTGDGVEDKVIQVTFSGTGTNQQVTVRGPVAPAQTGTMNTLVSSGPSMTGGTNTSLGSGAGIQAFAGIRDDPFFLDLEQFFRIVPDRKPVSGPLSQLPDQPTASAFRAQGQAVDYLRGLNTLAIVLEMPAAMLTDSGNKKIGVWGTISR